MVLKTIHSPALLFEDSGLDTAGGTNSLLSSSSSTSPTTTTNNNTPTASSTSLVAVTNVIVHPLVLLHVLDHHTRRQEEEGRVIGTLLGRRDGSTIEVTNCFAVPHAERGEEVAIGKDFNKRMLTLFLRTNRRETVVGWYASAARGGATTTTMTAVNTTIDEGTVSTVATTETNKGTSKHSTSNTTTTTPTTTPPPPLIADTSSLIHEFYASESEDGDPVHLVLDTRLYTNELSIRAYKSTQVVVQGEAVGSLFHELPCQLKSNEHETICLNEMIKTAVVVPLSSSLPNLGNDQQQQQSDNGNQKDNLITTTTTTVDSVRASMEKLHSLLDTTLQFVDSVVEQGDDDTGGGTKASSSVPSSSSSVVGVLPNPEVGRQLADALASVPRIRPDVFDRLFHDSLQDLLMIQYLSTITQTQLNIAEKLNATLGAE